MSFQHAPIVVAAARRMCAIQAEACAIDKEDSWKVYGDTYLKDAADVLDAAGVPQLVIALQAIVEIGTDSPEHLAAEAAIRHATGAAS